MVNFALRSLIKFAFLVDGFDLDSSEHLKVLILKCFVPKNIFQQIAKIMAIAQFFDQPNDKLNQIYNKFSIKI